LIAVGVAGVAEASTSGEASGAFAPSSAIGTTTCVEGAFSCPSCPRSIPDAWTFGSVSSVVAVSGPADRVRVSVSIEHDRASDLVVTLRAPDGFQWTLFNRGASGRDLIIDQVLPLQGHPGAGSWTLKVQDKKVFKTGRLKAWSLTTGQSCAWDMTWIDFTQYERYKMVFDLERSTSLPSPETRRGRVYVHETDRTGFNSDYYRVQERVVWTDANEVRTSENWKAYTPANGFPYAVSAECVNPDRSGIDESHLSQCVEQSVFDYSIMPQTGCVCAISSFDLANDKDIVLKTYVARGVPDERFYEVLFFQTYTVPNGADPNLRPSDVDFTPYLRALAEHFAPFAAASDAARFEESAFGETFGPHPVRAEVQQSEYWKSRPQLHEPGTATSEEECDFFDHLDGALECGTTVFGALGCAGGPVTCVLAIVKQIHSAIQCVKYIDRCFGNHD
jgi:subtilisin-like proprotein convertase family protein